MVVTVKVAGRNLVTCANADSEAAPGFLGWNFRANNNPGFRLGEEPNIRVGVAMITSAPEALSLHEKMASDLWRRAHKGDAAVRLMRDMIAKTDE